MKISWRTEWPSVALVALMCALSAIAWGAVPDRMAVHWGPAGAPDRFGSRAEGLLAIPATAGIVYALMIGLVLGVVTVLTVYSYLVWRQDPQRAGPGAAPRED